MILQWTNVLGNLEAQIILWVPMMYSVLVTHFKVHQMHKDWKQKKNGTSDRPGRDAPEGGIREADGGEG